jgi:hypothetical protein
MKITLMRHGRPLIDLTSYSRLKEIPDFMGRYDKAELDLSVPPPSEAISLALKSTVVVCSDLPRSLASAGRLGVPEVHVCDRQFREVLIPSVALSFPKLRDSQWVVLLRLLQMLGFSRGAESIGEARARAQQCAERLGKLASADETVLFVGHAFLNWLIGKELMKMGWKGSSVLGQRYWGFTEFHGSADLLS